MQQQSQRQARIASFLRVEDDAVPRHAQSSAYVLLDSDGSFRDIDLMKPETLDMHEFDFFDLPADMWSVSLITLTSDLSEIINGAHGDKFGPHLTRFLYAVGCCAMNLALQCTVMTFVQCYLVGESVWQLQDNYAKYHRDVFDSKGNFQADKWRSWDGPVDDLCSAVIMKTPLLFVFLFLWSARMMAELKTIKRLWDAIRNLASLPKGGSIGHSVVTRNGQTEVHALPGHTRALAYIFRCDSQTHHLPLALDDWFTLAHSNIKL